MCPLVSAALTPSFQPRRFPVGILKLFILVVGDMIFRIQGEYDVPGGSYGGGHSCNEDFLLLIS